MITYKNQQSSIEDHGETEDEGAASSGIVDLASLLKGVTTSTRTLVEHSYSSASQKLLSENCNVVIQDAVFEEQVMQPDLVAEEVCLDSQEVHCGSGLDMNHQQLLSVEETRGRSKRERKIPSKFLSDDSLVTRDFHDKSRIGVVSSKKSCKDSPATEESEDESSEESEDEGDEEDFKEYCICRKPHDNRFMIGCDACEEWYHGSCIGVNKKQSECFETYICPPCKEKNPSLVCVVKHGVVLDESGLPIVTSAKRPRTSSVNQSSSQDKSPAKQSSEKTVKTKKVKKVRPHTDNGSRREELTPQELEERAKFKEIIEQRKRELLEKEKKREKKKVSLDPTMNELFAVSDTLKSPTKTDEKKDGEKIRCLICKNNRVKTDKSVYCSFDCIKSHVKTTRKAKQAGQETTSDASAATVTYAVYDAFDLNHVKGSALKKPNVLEKELIHFLIRNPSFTLEPTLKARVHRKSLDLASDSRKSSISEASTPKTPTTPSTPRQHPLSSKELDKKKRRPSENQSERKGSFSKQTSVDSSVKIMYREKAEKSFSEALSSRIESSTTLTAQEKQQRRDILASGLGKDIENKLFELFQSEGKSVLSETGMKNYLVKYRTLLFNLKDAKNVKLFDSLFSVDPEQAISPSDLVRMTSEELARGSDLDVWRKEEAKKSLINSVIVNEEPSDGPKLKKTRKGEEEIDTEMLSAKRVSEDTFNPLEQILKDIKKTTTKTSKREETDDMPRSPPRTPKSPSEQSLKRQSSIDSTDASVEKRQRSSSSFCNEEDSGSSSSNQNSNATPSSATLATKSKSEVRRVTVNPELPSILTSLAGVLSQETTSTDEQIVSIVKSRRIVWEGFCSGFQESSSALSSASRFPLICGIANASDKQEKELLHKFSSIPTSLTVVGRINPEQVADYVSKITVANESSEPIVEMVPLSLKKSSSSRFSGGEDEFEDYSDDDYDDDESRLFKTNYDKFVSYLTERKRYAVVDVKSKKKASLLKDVYLFPFDVSQTQFSSSAMKQVFKNSPLMTNLKEVGMKKKSAVSRGSKSNVILVMLLVKKSSALRGKTTPVQRETSSKKTMMTPPQTLMSSLPTMKVAVTLPNHASPSIVSYTPTPTSILTSFTSSSQAVDPEEEEYDPGSYLPGLSPEHQDKDERNQQHEEQQLMEKAMIQMKLLQNKS